MAMRIVFTLAAGLAFGVLGAVAASASPALLPGIVGSDIEWHPSTRHWDHHFHSHQRSRFVPHLAEVEGYGRAPALREQPYAHRPTWNGAAPGAQRY